MSVIVPVYEVEEWLPRCVASILRQTHRNLEVILVNDGSTDRGPEICDWFGVQDARVRVIHQDNAGLSVARNVGMRAATGRFVTFVDSDDWVPSNFVSELLQCLSDDGAIAVAGIARISSEDEASRPRTRGRTWPLSVEEAMIRMHTDMRDRLVVTCGKLYPRSILSGIEFPIGRIHEDVYTTYRLLARATSLVMCDSVQYYYWSRSNSISAIEAKTLAAALDYAAALKERIAFLSEEGPRKAEVLAQHRRAQILAVLLLRLDERTSGYIAAEVRAEASELLRSLPNDARSRRLKLTLLGYLTAPRLMVGIGAIQAKSDRFLRRYIRHSCNRLPSGRMISTNSRRSEKRSPFSQR